MNISPICTHPDYKGKKCWIAIIENPGIDTVDSHSSKDMQDDITICNECHQFTTITKRGFGRRTADQTVISTVLKLIEQLSIKKKNLEQTADKLKLSLNQLNLLKDITDALARSDNLEKSLRIILTGATSGDAFGFNRAGVFLINENNNTLEGKSAVGPENADEAYRIWEKISEVPLSHLLEEILMAEEFVPCSLDILVSGVKISLENTGHPLVMTLNKASEQIIDMQNDDIVDENCQWWPQSNEIVVVPLVCEGETLGLLVADNAISNDLITSESIDALKSLANACAAGLQNAILHEKLQAQLKELARVHELFKLNQAYLVHHERLADIGTLATKVAHEFRIPLVTIGGYARRILKTHGTDKFNEKMVNVIIDEVDRLTKIASEILEYSRQSKLNIEECDLNTIVDESLSQLEDKLESSGIDMEKIFCDETLHVKVDSERLKQVILNLVENAVDAMADGGKLSIKTSRYNEYVIIDIEDTGPGIDEYGLENLFNLFYTTKNTGSGLGLPVSKKIIDDHGGYINVDSTPSKGTLFSVRLPAITSAESTNNIKNDI